MDYSLVLDRVAASRDLLSPPERQSAERVVELCRELQSRPRQDGKLVAAAADLELRRELGRLSETLGRRSSHALPAAALVRAVLADLGGDLTGRDQACADCHFKLALFGW